MCAISTDWIECVWRDNERNERKRTWRFGYHPSAYRLELTCYVEFVKKDGEFQPLATYGISAAKTPMTAVNRRDIPIPSGVWLLAQEAALAALNIDSVEEGLPEECKEIARNEFRKRIRIANGGAPPPKKKVYTGLPAGGILGRVDRIEPRFVPDPRAVPDPQPHIWEMPVDPVINIGPIVREGRR